MSAAKKSNKKNHTFWTFAPANFPPQDLASFPRPLWADLSVLQPSPQPGELSSFRRERWFNDLSGSSWETNIPDWPKWHE